MNSHQALEQQLKATRPVRNVPVGLHDSIIGAVRAAGELPHDDPLHARAGGRLAAIVVVTAVLVGMGIKFGWPRHDPGVSLTVVAPVLETSHTLAEEAPSVVFDPLARELSLVNRDARLAVAHLLASIP